MLFAEAVGKVVFAVIVVTVATIHCWGFIFSLRSVLLCDCMQSHDCAPKSATYEMRLLGRFLFFSIFFGWQSSPENISINFAVILEETRHFVTAATVRASLFRMCLHSVFVRIMLITMHLHNHIRESASSHLVVN